MPLRNHRCERKGRGGRQQESLRERRALMRLRAPSSIVTVRRNVPILSSLTLTARCVLYYNTILARGPAGRVPVASPRALVLQGHRALSSHQQNVSPFYHSQEETSLSSRTTIDQGDFAPLWNPRSEGRCLLSPLNTQSTRAWRFAPPPGPIHAQTTGRLIAASRERSCRPQYPIALSSARTATAYDQESLVYAFRLKATLKRGIDKPK